MPSLINELALRDLQQVVEDSGALIVVDAAGLKADESLALRRELSDVGAAMRVAKARLVVLAVGEDLAAKLEHGGSLAVITGEDISAAAKIVNGLAKEEKLSLKAGMVEGRAVDAAGAARFADLPTKHEAQAMAVRAIRGPLVKLGRLAKAPVRRLGRAIKAHHEKLEEG